MTAAVGFDRVVIVGLGLIGGSLAHVLAPHHRVIGVDTDRDTCDAARADGVEVVTDIRDALTPGSLVVVAVPVTAIGAVFSEIAGRDGVLVTDVTSVKQPVVGAAADAGLRFVGGHPMAGREVAGYRAASDSLFSGARWALCLDGAASVRDVLSVAEMVLTTGASIVPTVAVDHDRAVAVVSHLPHVLASALAACAGVDPAHHLMFGLAAGSFRDGTRVARSPAPFWAGISAENAANLAPIVRAVGTQFGALADALDAGDLAAVESYFARGVDGRVEFERRTALPTTLTLPGDAIARDDDSVRATLLDLGRRGGYVTHIQREPEGVMLRARVPELPAARS